MELYFLNYKCKQNNHKHQRPDESWNIENEHHEILEYYVDLGTFMDHL